MKTGREGGKDGEIEELVEWHADHQALLIQLLKMKNI
jgi:hypothetical protein